MKVKVRSKEEKEINYAFQDLVEGEKVKVKDIKKGDLIYFPKETILDDKPIYAKASKTSKINNVQSTEKFISSALVQLVHSVGVAPSQSSLVDFIVFR